MEGGDVGGGGGAGERDGPLIGGRGADDGGGGRGAGGAGGAGADAGGGGGARGVAEDGFRSEGSGGGFLPIGGGGPRTEAVDIGRGALAGVLRKLAIEGTKADVLAVVCACGLNPPGSLGATPVGGFGAAPLGGIGGDGTELTDESAPDMYEESRFATPSQINS